MNKEQFFSQLNLLLKSLPSKELKKTSTYYNEIINDYIEDGLTEEMAISKLGDIQDIANEILTDNENSTDKRSIGSNVLIGILLVLGSPLWGSLVLAAAMLLLSFYIILFCPVIIFGTLTVAFLASSIVGIVTTLFILLENLPYAIYQFGLGIFLLGLSIVFGWILLYTSKYIFKLYSFTWKRSLRLFRKRGLDNGK